MVLEREALCVAAGRVFQTWDVDAPVCWANGNNSHHQGRVRPPDLLPLGKALPFIYTANLGFGDSDSLCGPGWF